MKNCCVVLCWVCTYRREFTETLLFELQHLFSFSFDFFSFCNFWSHEFIELSIELAGGGEMRFELLLKTFEFTNDFIFFMRIELSGVSVRVLLRTHR